MLFRVVTAFSVVLFVCASAITEIKKAFEDGGEDYPSYITTLEPIRNEAEAADLLNRIDTAQSLAKAHEYLLGQNERLYSFCQKDPSEEVLKSHLAFVKELEADPQGIYKRFFESQNVRNQLVSHGRALDKKRFNIVRTLIEAMWYSQHQTLLLLENLKLPYVESLKSEIEERLKCADKLAKLVKGVKYIGSDSRYRLKQEGLFCAYSHFEMAKHLTNFLLSDKSEWKHNVALPIYFENLSVKLLNNFWKIEDLVKEERDEEKRKILKQVVTNLDELVKTVREVCNDLWSKTDLSSEHQMVLKSIETRLAEMEESIVSLVEAVQDNPDLKQPGPSAAKSIGLASWNSKKIVVFVAIVGLCILGYLKFRPKTQLVSDAI